MQSNNDRSKITLTHRYDRWIEPASVTRVCRRICVSYDHIPQTRASRNIPQSVHKNMQYHKIVNKTERCFECTVRDFIFKTHVGL